METGEEASIQHVVGTTQRQNAVRRARPMEPGPELMARQGNEDGCARPVGTAQTRATCDWPQGCWRTGLVSTPKWGQKIFLHKQMSGPGRTSLRAWQSRGAESRGRRHSREKAKGSSRQHRERGPNSATRG